MSRPDLDPEHRRDFAGVGEPMRGSWRDNQGIAGPGDHGFAPFYALPIALSTTSSTVVTAARP